MTSQDTANETKAEQVDRVRQMAARNETWDLSFNDQVAIAGVWEDRANLLAAAKDIEKWAREAEGQRRVYRFEFDSPCGVALRAAIARAEGQA